jgi:hypothetical protein
MIRNPFIDDAAEEDDDDDDDDDDDEEEEEEEDSGEDEEEEEVSGEDKDADNHGHRNGPLAVPHENSQDWHANAVIIAKKYKSAAAKVRGIPDASLLEEFLPGYDAPIWRVRIPVSRMQLTLPYTDCPHPCHHTGRSGGGHCPYLADPS